jgi:hypothetical protein
MKVPSLSDLKKELNFLDEKEAKNLLLELVKYSSENKSFFYFQLYSRENVYFYTQNIKDELELLFLSANTNHLYVAKKSIQAIRSKLTKFLKFTKNKADQAEVILFFCEKMNENGFLSFRYPVITNIFNSQLNKAKKLVLSLHEDLQSDYESKIQELESISASFEDYYF